MKEEKCMNDWDVGEIFYRSLDIGETFSTSKEDVLKK